MKNILKPLIFISLGLILGFFLSKTVEPSAIGEVFVQKDIRNGEGRLTNPLLECSQNQSAYSELKPFKSDVEELVSKLESEEEINKVAVYFRDLNNGPWFGIDEQMQFSPASLLKVPLAIAYYKLAENNKVKLDTQVVFKGSSSGSSIVQTIVPKEGLTIGQSYTLEDLIHRMLAYSDNESYGLLLDNIDLNDLSKVYKDFGFNMGDFKNSEEIVNIQNYSSFFRILYNVSYLNSENSEKLLNMLSESEFTAGLVSGLPKNLTVAHKFGERGLRNSTERQFSDCGIVYYPEKPYLLCVATKGTDFVVQAQAIQQVSELVYKEIKNQVK